MLNEAKHLSLSLKKAITDSRFGQNDIMNRC